MLDMAPQNKDYNGAQELAYKQHSMWITELLDKSWYDQVIGDTNALKKKLYVTDFFNFYVCPREYVWYSKEVVIAAEQQYTNEKLTLENFDCDIQKFIAHARLYIWQILNTGSPITNQHCILTFSSLK